MPICSSPRFPDGIATRAGESDAARPVVLAPYYPLPDRVEPGLEIPLGITLVGCAARHRQVLLAAIADVGRAPGVGPDRITYQLAGTEIATREMEIVALPADPASWPGTVPRMGIGLTAPLILRTHDAVGRRRASLRPTLGDLFRAAARTLSQLFRLCGEPLDLDLDALKAAADQARTEELLYEPFRQAKWSSRGQQRFELIGAVGGGVYHDVPWALIPWLYWGGRLHVAGHRVAGAGGWRLLLS